MDLHRSGKAADWTAVPVAQHNRWQRIANATYGIVTPGNVLTIAGFIAVLFGLWRLQYGEYPVGFVAVGIGRLCDLLDGIAADRTGTKSPLGESLDAGFDKLASIAALALLYTAHIISLPILVMVLLPNVTNALVTVAAYFQGVSLHPSRFGKYAMASAWLGLAALIIAAWLGYDARYWIGIGYIGVGLSLALGLTSTLEYIVSTVRRR